MKNEIEHVSDTALWVAMYRAKESVRPDAVFKDPLAAKLAGERGKDMMKSTPHSKAIYFAMVVRTVAIDRLIQKAISLGIDTVINLGAGMDTRPYRMDLPADLKWIEVDFKRTISYKEQTLENEKPVCQLRRIAADLSDDDERKKLFAQLGSETQKALVITEGVIAYLDNYQAEKLSKDLYAIPSFQYWIMDYMHSKRKDRPQEEAIQKRLKNAPWKFNIENPVLFFESHGWKWKEEDNIYILDEADRIGRKAPLYFPVNILRLLFPKKMREIGNKTYGFTMFYK